MSGVYFEFAGNLWPASPRPEKPNSKNKGRGIKARRKRKTPLTLEAMLELRARQARARTQAHESRFLQGLPSVRRTPVEKTVRETIADMHRDLWVKVGPSERFEGSGTRIPLHVMQRGVDEPLITFHMAGDAGPQGRRIGLVHITAEDVQKAIVAALTRQVER